MLQGKVFKTLDFMEAATGISKIKFDTKTTANILYILPYANDTDYLAIGNGTLNADFKWFAGATTKYILFDVGLQYLSLVNVQLYAPDITTSTTGTSGLIYKNANGALAMTA